MSNSFGKSQKSGSDTVSPQSLWAAGQYSNYLKGLDTSVVDNTYKNIADNAYKLSNNLPNYVYHAGGDNNARERMENAVFNQAAGKLAGQFAQDQADLNTRLQNQGLSVGSPAYERAMSSLQGSQYGALQNAAYKSIAQGQKAYSNSLNDAVVSGNFTNNARRASFAEILDTLQNSMSKNDVEQNIYNAWNSSSSVRKKENSNTREGLDMKTAVQAATAAAALFSDLRLKENISPVGRLDNGLTVYRFNYIGSPQTQIGLIAQEVKEQMPEAVIKDKDGYYKIDYAKATR